MRKYFLLGAVALLATSTANATTDYAEVTAKATIEVANTFGCDEIDFGTIVVKQDNHEFVIASDSSGYTIIGEGASDFISMNINDPKSTCHDFYPDLEQINVTTKLTNDKGDKMTLSCHGAEDMLYPELTIPANVKAGTYTGSFTITINY
ncbi:MAG: hypothetical protein E7016_04995 [Alphaproteobacteria bacterium]|nr:hypothetical protein [Alphaproteobacteria bacterium]